jgi:hypothetical protein
MFEKNTGITAVPFDINGDGKSMIYLEGMFAYCENLIEVPKITNMSVYVVADLFSNCYNLRNIPDDLADTWDFSNSLTKYTAQDSVFQQCRSLRQLPMKFVNTLIANGGNKSGGSYTPYSYMCYHCVALDEIVDLPIVSGTYTNNMF